MHMLTAGTKPIALLTAGSPERVRSTGELMLGRDIWWNREAYMAACDLLEALDVLMSRAGKNEAIQVEYAEISYKVSMYEARRKVMGRAGYDGKVIKDVYCDALFF